MAFQLWKLASLIPCFQHKSAVLTPASCSFRMVMICSSVCLLRFIVWSFPQGQTPVHPGSVQKGNATRSINRKIGWAGAVKNLESAGAETAIRVGQGRLGAVKDRAVVRAGGHVSNSTLMAGNVMKTPVLVPASSPTVSPTKLSFLTGLNGSNKLLFGSK